MGWLLAPQPLPTLYLGPLVLLNQMVNHPVLDYYKSLSYLSTACAPNFVPKHLHMSAALAAHCLCYKLAYNTYQMQLFPATAFS